MTLFEFESVAAVIDGLPEGWSTAALSDLVYIAARIGWRGLKAEEYTESGPLFASVHCLNNGDRVDFDSAKHISWERYEESPEIALRRDDILLTKDGAGIGKLGIVEELPSEATINSSLLLIRSLGAFHPRFLFYNLMGPAMQELVQSRITGSTTPHLFQRDIKRFELRVPPLAEQERIAAKVEALLGKVRAVSGRLAKVPNLLKRFRQSVLAAACSGRLTADWRQVAGSTGTDATEPILTADADTDKALPSGWLWITGAEIFDVQNGRAFPSNEYCSDGVRLVRPGNLHISGNVMWNDDNTARLPDRWATEFPDFVLGNGELLINLTAQSLKDEFLGRVCFTRNEEPALLNQRIGRIRCHGSSDLRPYLFLYFKSPRFRQFVNTLDTGSLIRHMHSKDVLRHTLPLPPSAEQHEIVRRVEALFALTDAAERRAAAAAARAQRITQAVLAKAFRGELVPTEAELARREGRDYESASVLVDRIRAERAAAEAKGPNAKRRTRQAGRGP